MKSRVFPFLCLLLAAGCANTPAAPGTRVEPVMPRHDPDTERTFHILMGELAAERGNMPVAVQEYLQAARSSTDPALARHATLLAYGAADMQAAQEAARRWQSLAPDNAEGGHFTAVILARLGEWQASARQFEALVTSGADRDYSVAAKLLESETDRSHALPVLQQIARDRPDSAAAHFALGHAALKFRAYGTAEQEARAALTIEPGAEQSQILLARALAAQDRFSEAIPLMRSVLAAKPGSLAFRLAYAALLAEAQETTQARKELDSILLDHPHNVDALLTLGLLGIQTKDWDLARKQFLELYHGGQRMDEAAYYLGSVAELQKQYPAALDWYRRVGEGDRWMDAQTAIGRTLLESGTADAAIGFFDQLVGADPADAAELRLNEGLLFEQAGDRIRAMHIYDAALQAKPDDTDLLYARAMLREATGDAAGAERDLRALLVVNPDDSDALNALGYTLTLHTTRYQEARTYIDKALALEPGDPAIQDSLGWVDYRLGDLPSALALLQKAYSQLADPEIAAHLVEVLLASGDQEQARSLWLKAMQTDPDDAGLKALAPRFKP